MPELNPALSWNAPAADLRSGQHRFAQMFWQGVQVPLLVTDATWDQTGNPQFTDYAHSPVSGPKQQTLHSRGTSEVVVRLSFELTEESIAIASLMDAGNRGQFIDSLVIHQGEQTDLFENLYWSNFSLSGSEGQIVTGSLEMRSANPPTPTVVPAAPALYPTPIPGWATGNDDILSWSLSHQVSLQPVWGNTYSLMPVYYRPGTSVWSMQITTLGQPRVHDTLRISIGDHIILEGVVTSSSYPTGGKSDPRTYVTQIANCGVTNTSEPLYSDGFAKVRGIAAGGGRRDAKARPINPLTSGLSAGNNNLVFRIRPGS